MMLPISLSYDSVHKKKRKEKRKKKTLALRVILVKNNKIIFVVLRVRVI